MTDVVGRHRRLFGAMLVALLLAGACGGDDDDGAAPDDADTTTEADAPDDDGAGGTADDPCTKERVGGSITMGVLSPARLLDPAGVPADGRGGTIEWAAVYDVLMRYDTETLEYEPHLAESLTADDDLMRWTLTLRDGVTFANGDPLDADAVVASIERHRAAGPTSSARRGLDLVEQVEAVDDTTVVFDLSVPWGAFPFVLAGPGGMVVNTAVADPTGTAFATDPAGGGAGPYVVERFAPGEELVLRARDDYWGGPVCIEELRFISIPGADATLDAFELDEIQVAFLLEPAAIARAMDDGTDGFRELFLGSLVLVNNGVRDTTPPTADPRVRAAVVHAIDVETLNERYTDGTGLAGSALIHPESALSPDVDGPAYDADRARQLVEEAKADGWDGGIRLTAPNIPSGVEWAVTVEAMLESVGFAVETSLVQYPDLIRMVTAEANFDLAFWNLGLSDASLWYDMVTLKSDSPNNYIGYANPEWDEVVDDLRAAADADGQRDVMARAQEIWNEDLPSAVYGVQDAFIATQPEVQGVVQTADGVVLFHDAHLEE